MFKDSQGILENPFSNKIAMTNLLKRYGTLFGLLILCIYFAFTTGSFLTFNNVINILTQITMIAICSIGMSYAILSGNIDLSVGSVVSLVSIMGSMAMVATGSTLIGILTCLVVGGIFGLFNGFLIAYIGVPAFVCTLASSSIATGLTFMMCKGLPIYEGITKGFIWLGQGYIGPIPVPPIILIILFVIGYIHLTQTRSGRYLIAVGGNCEASRLAGINTKRIIMLAFSVSGLAAACSGIILTARLGTGQPIGGGTYTLDAIASSFLGQTVFRPGEVNLPGTFVGALIIGILNNGLTLLNIPYYFQDLFKGFLIILAVAINSYYLTRKD
jgi:ribose transport system permease protein